MGDILSKIRDIIDEELKKALEYVKKCQNEKRKEWMKRAVTLALILAKLPSTERGLHTYILNLEKSAQRLPYPYREAILNVVEKITVFAQPSYRQRKRL